MSPLVLEVSFRKGVVVFYTHPISPYPNLQGHPLMRLSLVPSLLIDCFLADLPKWLLNCSSSPASVVVNWLTGVSPCYCDRPYTFGRLGLYLRPTSDKWPLGSLNKASQSWPILDADARGFPPSSTPFNISTVAQYQVIQTSVQQ
jgi:hypothetical protein